MFRSRRHRCSSACPQGDKLLRTLAAYDAVGVQVPDDAVNLNALLDKLGIAVRAAAFPVWH